MRQYFHGCVTHIQHFATPFTEALIDNLVSPIAIFDARQRRGAERQRSPMSGIQSHPNREQMCVPLIRWIASLAGIANVIRRTILVLA
jgi:hypothetical protein